MAAKDFPHEKCCGPLFCGIASTEHEVVVDEAAAKFGVTSIWLDFLGVDGTENAAEIAMTDDTADAATTAVAADRGLRGCRETISIFVLLDYKGGVSLATRYCNDPCFVLQLACRILFMRAYNIFAETTTYDKLVTSCKMRPNGSMDGSEFYLNAAG